MPGTPPPPPPPPPASTSPAVLHERFPTPPERLGEILLRRGDLTPDELDMLLEAQRARPRPLGVLAEEMLGLSPAVVEEAWAEQFAGFTATINPLLERVDPHILASVSTRQAWQFRLIPLRRQGHEVMVCTIQRQLPRALRFAYRHFGPECWIVLCDEHALYAALQRHYPMNISREEWLGYAA